MRYFFKNLKNNFKIRTNYGTIPSVYTMMFEVRNNNLRSKIDRFLKKRILELKMSQMHLKMAFLHNIEGGP